MGDAVNIAARLEGIAKPGTICLSDDAYRQVKGRLEVEVSDLGAIQLKNIAEPVRAYLVEVRRPDPPRKHRWAPLRRRVAALATLAILAVAGAVGWDSFAGKPSTTANSSTTPPSTAQRLHNAALNDPERRHSAGRFFTRTGGGRCHASHGQPADAAVASPAPTSGEARIGQPARGPASGTKGSALLNEGPDIRARRRRNRPLSKAHRRLRNLASPRRRRPMLITYPVRICEVRYRARSRSNLPRSKAPRIPRGPARSRRRRQTRTTCLVRICGDAEQRPRLGERELRSYGVSLRRDRRTSPIRHGWACPGHPVLRRSNAAGERRRVHHSAADRAGAEPMLVASPHGWPDIAGYRGISVTRYRWDIDMGDIGGDIGGYGGYRISVTLYSIPD